MKRINIKLVGADKIKPSRIKMFAKLKDGSTIYGNPSDGLRFNKGDVIVDIGFGEEYLD